jgi:hypothetical protein
MMLGNEKVVSTVSIADKPQRVGFSNEMSREKPNFFNPHDGP